MLEKTKNYINKKPSLWLTILIVVVVVLAANWLNSNIKTPNTAPQHVKHVSAHKQTKYVYTIEEIYTKQLFEDYDYRHKLDNTTYIQLVCHHKRPMYEGINAYNVCKSVGEPLDYNPDLDDKKRVDN